MPFQDALQMGVKSLLDGRLYFGYDFKNLGPRFLHQSFIVGKISDTTPVSAANCVRREKDACKFN